MGKFGCYVLDGFPRGVDNWEYVARELSNICDYVFILQDNSEDHHTLRQRFQEMAESAAVDDEAASQQLWTSEAEFLSHSLDIQEELSGVSELLQQFNAGAVMLNIHDKTIENLLEEVEHHTQSAFQYKAWEFGDEDEREEEDDLNEIDAFSESVLDLGEEQDDEEYMEAKRESRKPYGDTYMFDPIILKEKDLLVPGKQEYMAKYREKDYLFYEETNMEKFVKSPQQYLPKDSHPKVPPIRLCIVGPSGSGKTEMGRFLAKKLNIFHIQFRDYLQEKMVAKFKRQLGFPWDKEAEEEKENRISEKRALKRAEEYGREQTGSDDEPEEEEMPLTSYEENVRSYLQDDDALEQETMDEYIQVSSWWNNEPFKSTGFILDDFPGTEYDLEYLSKKCLFLDAIVILSASEDIISIRKLPSMRKRWRKRQEIKKQAETIIKETKISRWREVREAKRIEILADVEQRKKLKLEARASKDSYEESEEEEEEEDDSIDIESILAEEYPEEDLEESEEEEQITAEHALDLMMEDLYNKYEDEVNKLTPLVEYAAELRIPRIELDASAKISIVKYKLNLLLERYVKNREAYLERVYPIHPDLAKHLLQIAYKLPSGFRKWCPVKLLEEGAVLPSLENADHHLYPAIYRQYIYFMGSRDDREKFIKNPIKYTHNVQSPPTMIPMRLAILGPPKSGKTSLAKRFCKELGLVRLSIGEAMRSILEKQPGSHLASELRNYVESGETIPHTLAIQALDISLLDAQCQDRGYILDGYPLTLEQLRLLHAYRIHPFVIFNLNIDRKETFLRAFMDRNADVRPYPLPDSEDAIEERLQAYDSNTPAVISLLTSDHHNLVHIDASRSKWWMWNTAYKIACDHLRSIQTYKQRIAQGKAISIKYMCISPSEYQQNMGEFKEYCPVTLAESDELLDCSKDTSHDLVAEYRGKYYKLANESKLHEFLSEPGRFTLPGAPRQLRPEESLPRHISAEHLKDTFPAKLELQGFCPVTYIEGNMMSKALVSGSNDYVAKYEGKLYAMASAEMFDKFCRNPERYVNCKLPNKLPAAKVDMPLATLPMLGYLEQTMAAALVKALTAVGCFKPKYPFLSCTKSALVYVAYHLKGYNDKKPQYIRNKYLKKLLHFEDQCNLVRYLGKEMTNHFRPVIERPIDFDHKMSVFLSCKETAQLAHRSKTWVA